MNNCSSLKIIDDSSGVVSYFHPNIINFKNPDKIFEELFNSITWRQDEISLYGKTYNIPRKHQWFADSPDIIYIYSGIKLSPVCWTPSLLEIKNKAEEISKTTFNSALVNLYETGTNVVGWHSDDESEIGSKIASVSFGAERDFLLRNKFDHKNKRKIILENRSLLLIEGETQKNWDHSLPKRTKILIPRINITFRNFQTL
jgi:alkylated DNA repair dioxygenase AlkB